MGRVARTHAAWSADAARYRRAPPLAFTSRLTVDGAPAQRGGDRSDGLAGGTTPGDLLPLGHRQPTGRPLSRFGPDPAAAHQLRPHGPGGQAQLPRCRLNRLARPQPNPDPVNGLRRQPPIPPTTHRNLLHSKSEKCCVDPLRPPADPDVLPDLRTPRSLHLSHIRRRRCVADLLSDHKPLRLVTCNCHEEAGRGRTSGLQGLDRGGTVDE